ncbi:MAG: hypothetical protein KA779_09880, partial [Propionivibrio sp.]|nr:hypothetical protein [Propionivibrio sp.]
MVALVGDIDPELQTLLEAEAEGHLQADGELHPFRQVFALGRVGGFGPMALERRLFADAEGGVIAGDE